MNTRSHRGLHMHLRYFVVLGAIIGVSLLSTNSARAEDAASPALMVDGALKKTSAGAYTAGATNWGHATGVDPATLKLDGASVPARACPAGAQVPAGAKCFAVALSD